MLTILRAFCMNARPPGTRVLAYYRIDTVVKWKQLLAGATPTGTVPITHGKTEFDVTERRIAGKFVPCIVIASPGERKFCVAPEDNVDEWVTALSSLEPPPPSHAAKPPVVSVALVSSDDSGATTSSHSQSSGARSVLPENDRHLACVWQSTKASPSDRIVLTFAPTS